VIEARNFRLLAHHDLDGHGDGMQVVKSGDHVYVAHLGTSAMALSILDCADPENPKLLRQIEHPPNTHRHKVQVVGDVLIQNSEQPYFGGPVDGPGPVTGLLVCRLDDPSDPRPVGFHPAPGPGVHRIWYSEAPHAHIATHLPGGRTRGYEIVDLSDPAHPASAGRWWIPGTGESDAEGWERLRDGERFEVHGVIPCGDRAYASCTDAGMVVLDISDIAAPRVVSRIDWSPPYGGFVHTSLPLPGRGLVIAVDEVLPPEFHGGDKRIWVVDVRDERQPVTIATFPVPVPPTGSPWDTYHDRPLRFGPHNVHENRPASFCSEELIFATWYNAGVRAYDLTDPHRPEEIGCFVPDPPPGQEAPQLNDLCVDADGIVYVTDRVSGGLYVLQFESGHADVLA
jgi:hypothetical protein